MTIRPFKIVVNNSRWRYRFSKDEAYEQTAWQTSCKVEAQSQARRQKNPKQSATLPLLLCFVAVMTPYVSVSCSTYRQIFTTFPCTFTSFELFSLPKLCYVSQSRVDIDIPTFDSVTYLNILKTSILMVPSDGNHVNYLNFQDTMNFHTFDIIPI